MAALEEQLLSYSENAENEGEEEEYLEEEVLQVHAALCDITQLHRTTVKCCDFSSLSLWTGNSVVFMQRLDELNV